MDCANWNPYRCVGYPIGRPIPPLLSIRDGLTIHCAASAVARHPRYVPMATDPGRFPDLAPAARPDVIRTSTIGRADYKAATTPNGSPDHTLESDDRRHSDAITRWAEARRYGDRRTRMALGPRTSRSGVSRRKGGFTFGESSQEQSEDDMNEDRST